MGDIFASCVQFFPKMKAIGFRSSSKSSLDMYWHKHAPQQYLEVYVIRKYGLSGSGKISRGDLCRHPLTSVKALYCSVCLSQELSMFLMLV